MIETETHFKLLQHNFVNNVNSKLMIIEVHNFLHAQSNHERNIFE